MHAKSTARNQIYSAPKKQLGVGTPALIRTGRIQSRIQDDQVVVTFPIAATLILPIARVQARTTIDKASTIDQASIICRSIGAEPS